MSEPLDMPDGPGWWAFEGHINYPCGALQLSAGLLMGE